MARIIAAHVDNDTRAESLRQALQGLGVAPSDTQKFYTPPAGQHASFTIGGDVDTDEGARSAPGSQRMGILVGAIIGAVVGFLAGSAAAEWAPLAGRFTLPLAVVLATGIGAHLGGLYGTMRGLSKAGKAVTGQKTIDRTTPRDVTQEPRRESVPVRRGGLMIATQVRDATREQAVIDVMRRAGAQDIEWADGRWEGGGWADFDPVSTPRLVDKAPPRAMSPQVSAAGVGARH